MLRLARFPLLSCLTLLLAPRQATAQPFPCLPGLPCAPAPPPGPALPPGVPPDPTPQLEASERARLEAEARGTLTPQLRADAAQQVHNERYYAWMKRGIRPEPTPVPLRLPGFSLVGLGQITGSTRGGDDTGFTNVSVGAAARWLPDAPVALELGVSFVQMVYTPGDGIRFAGVLLEPSFLFFFAEDPSSTARPYLRAGVDLTPAVGRDPRAPALFLGGHVGIGAELRAVTLGDGYLGFYLEGRTLLRAGVSGGDYELAKIRFGFGLGVGPQVTFRWPRGSRSS